MFGATPFFLFFGMITTIGFFYYKIFMKDTSLTWYEEELFDKIENKNESEKDKNKSEIELQNHTERELIH